MNQGNLSSITICPICRFQQGIYTNEEFKVCIQCGYKIDLRIDESFNQRIIRGKRANGKFIDEYCDMGEEDLNKIIEKFDK